MSSTPAQRERLAVGLLVSQMLFYGALCGFMAVAAYTLFIDSFGAQMLPHAYLATALTISFAFYGLTWLQRHWPLPRVLLAVMSGIALLCGVLWLLLINSSSAWFAFSLIPLITFIFQWGFILPGIQVGQIFDVRQVKRYYPIVTAGLTIGFVLSSIGAPFLVAQTGTLASTMAAALVSIFVALTLLFTTLTTFRDRFAQPTVNPRRRTQKTLGQLLQNPYIRLIASVQALTTVVWYVVEFIYLTLAEAQYPAVEDMAAFIGLFGAARNIAAIVVMLFIAGQVVSRFGLRLGLLAGPVGVGLGIIVLIGSALLSGVVNPLLFWIAILTFGIHMIMEESFTIPAQKTSYQLLPKDERLATETMVEGIGRALAVGISGLILLGLSALPDLTILPAAFLTLAIVVIWAGIALYLYRTYVRRLVHQLNRRVLDADSLTLSDGFNQDFIADLVHSHDLGKIRLALNVLENRDDPLLHDYVVALTEDTVPEVRLEAFSRIEQRQINVTLPQLEQRLAAEPNPAVQGAMLRVWPNVSSTRAADQVVAYLDAAEPAVHRGAMVGLLRDEIARDGAVARDRLATLARDADAENRAMAARIIGDVAARVFSPWLLPLLADDDDIVRGSALTAAAQIRDPDLLPPLVDNLMAGRATNRTAVQALKQYGSLLLPTVEKALIQLSADHQPACDIETACRLIYICGLIKGDGVIALLASHLAHPNPAVQRAILTALNAAHYQASSDEAREQVTSVLREHVTRAAQLLVAKEVAAKKAVAGEGVAGETNSQEPTAELLDAALAQAYIQNRQQIFYLLSFLYASRAMRRAEEQITSGTAAVRSFAMEMLDVTLSSQHKTLIWPLIEHEMDTAQRIQRLQGLVPVHEPTRGEQLRELICYPSIAPATWIQACALYTVGSEQLAEFAETVEGLTSSPDPLVQETAHWTQQRLSSQLCSSGPLLTDEMNSPQNNESTTPMYLTLEKVALLKAVDIFAETPDHVLAAVAAIVEHLDLDAGETFIQQGDIGDCMYLIIDGLVLVHQGEDEILTLGPGKSVGELAILDLSPREASVTAIEPTQLFRIDKEAFDEVLTERPEIARGVIRALSQRVRMTTAARQK